MRSWHTFVYYAKFEWKKDAKDTDSYGLIPEIFL